MTPRSPRGRSRASAQRSGPRAPERGGPHPARDPIPEPVGFLPAGLVLALILLGAAILHWDALRLPFFADDYLFLEQARGRSLPSALASPDGLGNFFRPVGRQLYFSLLGQLSGESPRAFHAVNLGLFLGILALLFVIVRRMAGVGAASVAAGFLALHYAADVPLRWVSGSQDLLAVFFALGAIALCLAGRRAWASPVFLMALLSKETVLLTPLIAAAADRRPGEPWRAAMARAWPLGLAVAVWAGLWLATASQRPGLQSSIGLEPLGALAVVVHLIQVSSGFEWRDLRDAFGRAVPLWLPLLPVALAVFFARAAAPAARDARARAVAGMLWALAASVPLVAVATVWSAYYYLFALCGVGLVLGALAARGPRWAALAVVVALAAGSQSGRENPEFASARGAWTWQSHTNRRYIDRATDRVGRYLADLKRQLPTAPPRSTFFFAGLPAFLAWQTADGPLVRWAYQDTSLRSYYQSDFTLEHVRRGPVFFFSASGDTMHEEVREPEKLRVIAIRALLNDRPETAHDLLTWLTEREPPTAHVLYFLAWLDWARGDTLAARDRLHRAGVALERGPAPEVERAAARLAVGDTASAIMLLDRAVVRYGLDVDVHGLMGDVLHRLNPGDPQAAIEALAARSLAPEDAAGWLRWGLVQANNGRHEQAIRSLERGLALGVSDPVLASQVRDILRQLQRMVPGGELVQQELRRAAP